MNGQNQCYRSISATEDVSYSCPAGYSLMSNRSYCQRFLPREYQPPYCPPGFSLSGNKCRKQVASTSTVTYSCPAGWTPFINICLEFRNPIANTTYSCPAGYTLSGSTCSRTENVAATPNTIYYCPAGYTLNGNNCSLTESLAATPNTTYSCPTNYTRSGSNCSLTESVAATPNTTYSCPAGYTRSGSTCSLTESQAATASTTYSCPTGYTRSGSNCSITESQAATTSTTYSCPAGYTRSGTNCLQTETRAATASTTYTCPADYTLSGSSCSRTVTQSADTFVTYSCPTGYTRSGTQCLMTEEMAATADTTYGCPAQYEVWGNVCRNLIASTSTTTYSCPAGYTLSGSDCSTVIDSMPVVPWVTASFSPDRLEALGDRATLSWSSAGASSCSGVPSEGTSATSGSRQYPLNQPADWSVTVTCSGPGGSVSATATLIYDPQEQQAGVYAGDVNSDGRYDFFVKQPADSAADTGDFILIQRSDRGFDVRSPLTVADEAQVLSWSPVELEITTDDYNIDGKNDLVVRGIKQIIDGVSVDAFDQFVFADTDVPNRASSARSLTPELNKFIEEFYQWFVDSNYFDDNGVQLSLSEWAKPVYVRNQPLWCDEFPYAEDPSIFPSVDRVFHGTFEEAMIDRRSFELQCLYGDVFGRVIYRDFWLQFRTFTRYDQFNEDALGMSFAPALPIVLETAGQRTISYWLERFILTVLGAQAAEELLGRSDWPADVGADIGIQLEEMAQVLVIVMRAKCAISGGDECIWAVEDAIMSDKVSDEDIDDEKLTWENLVIVIQALDIAIKQRRKDPNRRHCTYRKLKTDLSKVYYGRTSGTNQESCDEIVARRDERRLVDKGRWKDFLAAEPKLPSGDGEQGYYTMRGHEQAMIDSHVDDLDPPFTVLSHGLDSSDRVENRIRGVSRVNPEGCVFWHAGLLVHRFETTPRYGPYTGFIVNEAACAGVERFYP